MESSGEGGPSNPRGVLGLFRMNTGIAGLFSGGRRLNHGLLASDCHFNIFYDEKPLFGK